MMLLQHEMMLKSLINAGLGVMAEIKANVSAESDVQIWRFSL